jgi:hypothetical protein
MQLFCCNIPPTVVDCRYAVLYGSDTEQFLILARGVADYLPKRVDEVGLIGVQIEIVPSERLLQSQNLNQVVRREAGESQDCALQLPGRQPK